MAELENPFLPIVVDRGRVLATLQSDVTAILTDNPDVILIPTASAAATLVVRRHPRRGLMVQAFALDPDVAIWSVWFEREECWDVIERWWPGDPVPVPQRRHWWQRKAIR